MKIKQKIAFISLLTIMSTSVFAGINFRINIPDLNRVNIERDIVFNKTFTNCGSTGRTGPTLSDCINEYSQDWVNDSNKFSVNSGIQEWTVPTTGSYRIISSGAEAGGSSGKGAIIEGTLTLNKGDRLKILVGQKPDSTLSGGGGSFVVSSENEPLIIAGGGGFDGGGNITSHELNGRSETSGGTLSGIQRANHGAGGNRDRSEGGPGGGFSGDGAGTLTTGGGQSFLNGGLGASGQNGSYRGGFGGGGARNGSWGAGAGGGYSGGSASGNTSDRRAGGGGGSFNAGENQKNTAGANSGHGSVTITLLD